MKEGKFSLFSIVYNFLWKRKKLDRYRNQQRSIKIGSQWWVCVCLPVIVIVLVCVCVWISIPKWNQFKNVWHWNGLTDISIAVVEPTGFIQKSQQLMTQVHQTHAIRFSSLSLSLKNNDITDAQHLLDQNGPLFIEWMKKNAVLAKPDFIAIQFQNMHISTFYSLAIVY